MSDATILMVEDQSALARTYQGFLRNEPYSIEHVESGSAALKALNHMPNAVSARSQASGHERPRYPENNQG